MLRQIAIIIAVVVAAYAIVLPAPFKTMDDRVSIVENPAIRSVKGIPEIFQQGFFRDRFYYRPMVNLSFMGEYHLFGLNHFYYNLDNVLLHAVNAVLVFRIAAVLLANSSMGFWVGLLFALHPLQAEAVGNISGRTILLCSFFLLTAFYLFLAYERRRQVFLLAGALIFFGFGLLSKESAAIFPGVLALYLWFRPQGTWRQKLGLLCPFALIIVGYLWWRHHLGITQLARADDAVTHILGFITFLKSLIIHLRLFILPTDLYFDRGLMLLKSFASWQVGGILMFWIIVASALMQWRKRISTLVLFLLGWFALELLPVSQLVASIVIQPGMISTADHFLYLPLIPALMLLVLGAGQFIKGNSRHKYLSPVILKVGVGGFLLFFFCVTVEQNIYAREELSMLRRSVGFEPRNARMQASLGLQYVFRGNPAQAQSHFQAAVDADPFNAQYRISLGTSLCDQGRFIECMGQYVALDNPGSYNELLERQKSMTIIRLEEELRAGKDYDANGWFILGVYYAKVGRMDEAISAFAKALAYDPIHAGALMNAGSLYEAKQDFMAAEKFYQQVLQSPQATEFQRNFASEHLAIIKGKS